MIWRRGAGSISSMRHPNDLYVLHRPRAAAGSHSLLLAYEPVLDGDGRDVAN